MTKFFAIWNSFDIWIAPSGGIRIGFRRPAHRPTINDFRAMLAMAGLRMSGQAPNDHAAANMVLGVVPGNSEVSTNRRLRRKFSGEHGQVARQLAFCSNFLAAACEDLSAFTVEELELPLGICIEKAWQRQSREPTDAARNFRLRFRGKLRDWSNYLNPSSSRPQSR